MPSGQAPNAERTSTDIEAILSDFNNQLLRQKNLADRTRNILDKLRIPLPIISEGPSQKGIAPTEGLISSLKNKLSEMAENNDYLDGTVNGLETII